ncbi:MAG: heme-binding protein [Desulfosarcina sp.]
MATEEANYEVIRKTNSFEIRDYAPHIVAETVVAGKLEDAGSVAFKILFGYISGDNRSRQEVDMTGPQQVTREKINMTAPVGQQPIGDKWVVSFMMPAAYTMETLPVPENPKVKLRQVPGRRMAVIRYTGFWSESGYLKNKLKLKAWIRENEFSAVGDPIWARYNPPFTPWFLRRNEILIQVAPKEPTASPARAPTAAPLTGLAGAPSSGGGVVAVGTAIGSNPLSGLWIDGHDVVLLRHLLVSVSDGLTAWFRPCVDEAQ